MSRFASKFPQVALKMLRWPKVIEEDGGLLAFTVDVPAGRSADFEWSYTVTYPGDRTLGWME
jgi:hypothetical protein